MRIALLMMDENAGSSMPTTEELSPEERAKRGPNANPFVPVHPFTVFRRLFTECFGTFMLVSVDCGGAVTAGLSHGEVTPVARSFATGLIVMAMSSAMADVSGAHFNPSITAAFAMRGAFPWRMVPAYWAAQLAGAFSASAMLLAVFGDVAHLGATLPTGAPWRAFAIELVITSALVIISLGTATRHRVLGPQAAIAVGGTIAACALVARPISGASRNPARSLAPAVLSHTTASLWVYLLAPFVAAALGSAVLKIVHHRHHSEEREAAGGERK